MPTTPPPLIYIDKFHLPFPAVEAYLDAHGQQPFVNSSAKHANDDLLLRLPAELSALVFSFLSPASLDAARCVSRAWRIRIMSDTWVLSSVLESKESLAAIRLSGQETGGALHRSLLKKLDCESALVAIFEHPDTWRTRFRERKIEFHMPHHQYIEEYPHRPYTDQYFMSVKLDETAEFVAFMINEPSTDRVCTLLFYRLGLSGQPLYVGSTQYPKSGVSSPVPTIQDMVVDRLSRAWIIRLKIGINIVSYLVTGTDAFGKDDDEFKLLSLGSPSPEEPLSTMRDGDEKRMIDAITKTLNGGSSVWVFLACLPNTVVSVETAESNPDLAELNQQARHGGIGKDMRSPRNLVLAKHIKTGSIFVLGVSYLGPRATGKFLNVVALLSPPRQDLSFRNVTIARVLAPKCHALVSIIWQESESEDSQPELYYYNVPCAAFYNIPRAESTVDPHRATGSDDEEPALRNPWGSKSCISVQGQRITSIAPRMGGIHPSSPLRDLPDTQNRIHTDEVLGGLQLFYYPDQRENRARLREGYLVQKMMVWGWSKTDESCITLRTFDLSFADPSRLQSYQKFRRWTGAETSSSRINYCACPLHDEGSRVTLPTTSSRRSSSHHPSHPPSSSHKSTLSSLLTSSRKSSLTPGVGASSSSRGSVEQCDPRPRQEALERETRFYTEAITAMKRSGMSNESIETEWSGAQLTLRGKIPKPSGWRNF